MHLQGWNQPEVGIFELAMYSFSSREADSARGAALHVAAAFISPLMPADRAVSLVHGLHASLKRWSWLGSALWQRLSPAAARASAWRWATLSPVRSASATTSHLRLVSILHLRTTRVYRLNLNDGMNMRGFPEVDAAALLKVEVFGAHGPDPSCDRGPRDTFVDGRRTLVDRYYGLCASHVRSLYCVGRRNTDVQDRDPTGTGRQGLGSSWQRRSGPVSPEEAIVVIRSA